MVFLLTEVSVDRPRRKVHARCPVANPMTKQRATHNLLAFLDPGLDLGDISLRFVVDLIDLVLAEYL